VCLIETNGCFLLRIRSPYWLVAHSQHDKARANLVKLHDDQYDIDGHMAEISESLKKLTQDDESQGTMAECFDKENWKRTLVATSVFFIQNACGNSWVIGYMSCEKLQRFSTYWLSELTVHLS
jgi:hypothetical protein